ncbi:xanthine dehydrogenase family protein subunit M [soil metagenome]
MSSNLADFECLIPANVDEALRQRAENPGIIPISGGTEVMVWMNDGHAPGHKFQSLHALAKDWRYVREDAGGLRIGAMATYTDVRHHPHVASRYPLLVESARVTGAIQIQNRGTLAGNIANGSPAADTVPSLMAYDASVVLVSSAGRRELNLSEFFLGYRKNAMRSDELIAEIIVPAHSFAAASQYYKKVGTREAQAISKIVLAGIYSKGDVRLAWGCVGPVTLRTRLTEAAIAQGAGLDEAWSVLQSEIAPIEDIRSTKNYRTLVTRNILFDFMKRAMSS